MTGRELVADLVGLIVERFSRSEEAMIHVTDHALDSAWDRSDGFINRRMIAEEVRQAIEQGRTSRRPPLGVWTSELGRGEFFAWTLAVDRVYVVAATRTGHGGFAVKTMLVPERSTTVADQFADALAGRTAWAS